MFTTNTHIFQMEQVASFEDAESSNDIIVQAADMELFTDNLNETLQTRRQNCVRRRRSRYANSSSRREEENVSRRDAADQDTENSFDTQRTEVTHTIVGQTTQMMHEESQTIDITSNSETEFTNMQDVAIIYETPEDDYGYLNSPTNTNESNAFIENLPFHIVDWTLQDNQSTSKEKSSPDTCTVCYTNERTHVFIPCGHLACCFQCIKRLEANRCPICNVNYENYIRVMRP